MSPSDPKSRSSEPVAKLFGRSRDPIGGPPDLKRFFESYDEYFREADDHGIHTERLIAGFSRGDNAEELSQAFSLVMKRLPSTDPSLTPAMSPTTSYSPRRINSPRSTATSWCCLRSVSVSVPAATDRGPRQQRRPGRPAS